MTGERVHEHSHGHRHDHGHSGGRDLLIALSITLLMMVVEIVGGLLANSLALLSDAGHMLTDNLSLLLSFFAMRFATLPATERKTFGFYRLEILAALVNGIVLVLISFVIIYQAYLRLLRPEPVAGGLMLGVAAIGLVANVVGALVLMRHEKTNLNIRGAYLHILGDTLSSIGVVVGGGIIILTGWSIIDPILSILISLVIVYGAWSLVAESVNVLLESTPHHIDIDTVAAAIGGITGVREAYHIHVWTLTSGVYALSAHVLVDDRLVSDSREIVDAITALVAKQFNVQHSTIQLECDRCGNGVCSLPTAHRDR